MDDEGVLSTTFTGTATATGLISDGTNPYVQVVFTKSAASTITLTSGTATGTTGPVTPAVSVDPWKITVNDATAAPGDTIIVTGTIKDLFGNGVPSYDAMLDLGATTVGALGASEVATNSGGVFSTTFVAGSNQSGIAALTAAIETAATSHTAMTTNPLIGTAWAATGLTVDAHGEYTDSADITVSSTDLTLSATGRLNGGGTSHLSGSFLPMTSVDIYAKASGETAYALVDSVRTDADGHYGLPIAIVKTTTFLARAGGLSSETATTRVYSTVTLTGKSMSHNHVTLRANGAPNVRGTLTFYRSIAGRDPILATMNSDVNGNGVTTVRLPKGHRAVYVVFKAPGTGAGTSTTLMIAVK
jgi:hypothetical protein